MIRPLFLEYKILSKLLSFSFSSSTSSVISFPKNPSVNTLYGEHLLSTQFPNDFSIVTEIINPIEETALIDFLNNLLKKKKYEGNHWDSVISNYKETQISETKMSEEVKVLIKRCSEMITTKFQKQYQLLPLHVIELAKEGYIGPHIDSEKFSGELIGGLSLLSDRIIEFSPQNNSMYTNSFLLKLPRRSLYMIRGPLRYDHSHSIHGEENTSHRDYRIEMSRRLSIMFRDVHPSENSSNSKHQH